MFPTRVRYTAMSFPYHVGTGWVGGFLPVTSFASSPSPATSIPGFGTRSCSPGFRWWSPLLFLKETAGEIWRRCSSRAPVDVDRLLGFREHPADRQPSSFARRRSPARASRAFLAGDRDQHRPRRQDRGAGQGHTRDWRFRRQRVGHHADRPPRLGRVERRPAGQRRGISRRYARPRPCRARRDRAATAGPGAAHRPHCRPACSRRSRRAIGTTRAPSGRNALAISRTLRQFVSIGTSRSSVGMIVTFFHGSFCAASLGKTAGPVFPPGTAISDASRASTALSMMNPTSPATASGELIHRIIFPPFRFDHAIPF